MAIPFASFSILSDPLLFHEMSLCLNILLERRLIQFKDGIILDFLRVALLAFENLSSNLPLSAYSILNSMFKELVKITITKVF